MKQGLGSVCLNTALQVKTLATYIGLLTLGCLDTKCLSSWHSGLTCHG